LALIFIEMILEMAVNEILWKIAYDYIVRNDLSLHNVIASDSEAIHH